MNEEIQKLLDDTGWRILAALQENARISFSELARQVGLSAPAVTERIRRMEDVGIISGYYAKVNLEKLGFGLVAYIRLNSPNEKQSLIEYLSTHLKEVLECHRVTGADSWIIKVAVRDVMHLEEFLDHLLTFGIPTTSIVLSSPIQGHTVYPVE